MQKMTLADLKDLFPPYEPRDKTNRNATQKGARHTVNPVWLPGNTLAPAVYRHKHLAKAAPKRKPVLHPVDASHVAKRNIIPPPVRVDYPVKQNKQTAVEYRKLFGSRAMVS